MLDNVVDWVKEEGETPFLRFQQGRFIAAEGVRGENPEQRENIAFYTGVEQGVDT